LKASRYLKPAKENGNPAGCQTVIEFLNRFMILAERFGVPPGRELPLPTECRL
jgi:hypothetical protein